MGRVRHAGDACRGQLREATVLIVPFFAFPERGMGIVEEEAKPGWTVPAS